MRRPALVTAALLLAVAAASAAGGAAAPERVPILTQRDAGKTVTLKAGGTALFRVHADGALKVRGATVRMTEVLYFADPGFREWELHALRPGATVLNAPRTGGGRFTVTIRVVPR
jgi:hypothetical protein